MMAEKPILNSEVFIEGVIALHLASFVDSPSQDRGGLMVVGPTGVLKTTFLDVLPKHYENALPISNAYMESMKRLQPAFYNGTVRSIIFPDMQSIYAGDPRTGARIEQMIMQLSGEGTRTIGGEQDSRYEKFTSYCQIFGAMTNWFRSKNAARWENSGFDRRFLWATYTLEDPNVLDRAIKHWTRANIGTIKIPKLPADNFIPDILNVEQREEICSWTRYQPAPHTIQEELLCRAVNSLDWHYRSNSMPKSGMDTMREFSKCLGSLAGLIRLPEQHFDKKISDRIPIVPVRQDFDSGKNIEVQIAALEQQRKNGKPVPAPAAAPPPPAHPAQETPAPTQYSGLLKYLAPQEPAPVPAPTKKGKAQ